MASILLVVGLFFAIPIASAAEELRITSDSDWRQWELRGDATELSGGVIGPSFVRRDIDAVDNAFDFGGGIRDVGTNRARAMTTTESWLPARTSCVSSPGAMPVPNHCRESFP